MIYGLLRNSKSYTEKHLPFSIKGLVSKIWTVMQMIQVFSTQEPNHMIIIKGDTHCEILAQKLLTRIEGGREAQMDDKLLYISSCCRSEYSSQDSNIGG